MQISQNWWLSVWAAATEAATEQQMHVATRYYLGVYFSLGAVSLGFQFMRGLLLLYGSLRAAQRLHDGLVATVCHWWLALTIQALGLTDRCCLDLDCLSAK